LQHSDLEGADINFPPGAVWCEVRDFRLAFTKAVYDDLSLGMTSDGMNAAPNTERFWLGRRRAQGPGVGVVES
jgi:hypothetical protein